MMQWEEIERRPTLHQLERPDGLAELFAVVDVFDGVVKRGLHQPVGRSLVSRG